MFEIRQMMDDETFLFGDEMIENGFVDEIIKTDNQKTKSEMILNAKALITDCFSKMKDSTEAKEDFNKMAAFIDVNSFDFNIDKENKFISKPANAGNMEDVNMNLDELKAKYPALYDQLFKLGYEAGKKEGEEATQKRIEKASNILASKDYDESVKSQALKVVKNEMSVDVFDAFVALVDSQKEAKKQQEAQDETNDQGETNGQDKPIGDANKLVPENEADFQAVVAKDKERQGVK
jgi:hypothetical protein